MSKGFLILCLALNAACGLSANAEALVLAAPVQRTELEVSDWVLGVLADFEATSAEGGAGEELGFWWFGAYLSRGIYTKSTKPGLFTFSGEAEILRSTAEAAYIEAAVPMFLEFKRKWNVGVRPLVHYTDETGECRAVPCVQSSIRYEWTKETIAVLEIGRDIGVPTESLTGTARIEMDLGAGFASELAYSKDLRNVEDDTAQFRFGYLF